MSELTPTFAYEDEKVFAVVEGKVIASGKSISDIEESVNEQTNALNAERKKKAHQKSKKEATHIITPNGVKGELMSRTPSLWGEEVTARFENGEIQSFHVSKDVKFVTERQKVAGANKIERLATTLDNEYGTDKHSLQHRLSELESVSQIASDYIREGVSYVDESRLNKIRVAADAERAEVQSALDYLESEEYKKIDPLAPFTAEVVEQVPLGRAAKDDWLQVTADEMAEELDGQDFNKLLIDGPPLLVTELDTATLADSGLTRQAAQEHITSKTGGVDNKEVNDYKDLFVARTEVARRKELAARKQIQSKVAAKKHEAKIEGPDEMLFG